MALPFSICTLTGDIILIFWEENGRRKFRSRTSGNTDRSKAEMGRVREEKKEDQKRESLLKRRVRSQLARWEMKNCTPLWREAHFEVKMYEAHQVRTTFGSWDDEKVYGVVGGSTFRSQNAQTHQIRSTFRSRDVEKVHAAVARSTFRSQMYKTHQVRTTFWSWDVEKAHAVVAQSTFRSQKCRKLTGSEHFWTFRCRFAWQAQGIVHLVKSEQNVRVLWHFQKLWQAFEEHLQRWIFRGTRSTKDMFIRDVGRSVFVGDAVL